MRALLIGGWRTHLSDGVQIKLPRDYQSVAVGYKSERCPLDDRLHRRI